MKVSADKGKIAKAAKTINMILWNRFAFNIVWLLRFILRRLVGWWTDWLIDWCCQVRRGTCVWSVPFLRGPQDLQVYQEIRVKTGGQVRPETPDLLILWLVTSFTFQSKSFITYQSKSHTHLSLWCHRLQVKSAFRDPKVSEDWKVLKEQPVHRWAQSSRVSHHIIYVL